jgi:signal transduction histidine kinase
MSSDDLQAAREEANRLRKELREVQLRFVEAAKLESLERLARGVAHEVRNPLASLQMGLDYFSRKADVSAADEGILRIMQNAIERTNRIVLEFVDFSRAKEVDFRLENLNLVVRRALNVVEPDLQAADIRVDLALTDGLPTLRLDALKMEQVIVNLFANAIEASPVCGKIEVKTTAARRDSVEAASEMAPSTEERICMVEIRDWGSGIPHQIRSKIFDPFFTTKSKGVSTGLGLFVARTIVGLHEGVLTVENVPSGGVLARIIIPAYSAGIP